MIFCHIVDDYYLQGWLASAKQKTWWKKNAPDPLYKYDYIIALIEHAFSWTFMIHLPIIILVVLKIINVNTFIFIELFIWNWFCHSLIDNLKANQMKINLIQDQIVHIIFIILTWTFYQSYI